MKIVFSGGGTLGPVTPLLAMKEMIQEAHPQAQFVWVGTKAGPERELIAQLKIPFFSVSSGKLRRYFSLWNITDMFRIAYGFFQSLVFLWREDPDVCISAGGFISVPLHAAAWLLGVPTWIHQQDVRVGLANKLMAPTAKHITTALEPSVALFNKKKTTWLGNPIRKEIFEGTKKKAEELFSLDTTLPVLFVTGGGTGSMAVNTMVVRAAQNLEGVCQIIHLSGKERPQDLIEPAQRHLKNYQARQFFTTEMKEAYAAADLVISRGGFGTITELAALSKPAILIPKPGHQEENVAFLDNADAVVLVSERTSDGNNLAKIIKDLFADDMQRVALGKKLNSMLPPAKKEMVLDILSRIAEK